MNSQKSMGGSSDLNVVEPTDGAAPPPSQWQISIFDIALILLRHRIVLLASLAAGCSAGGLLALLLPVSYTATTTILPPQQSVSISSAMLSQLGGLGSVAGLSGLPGLKNPTDLYVGLLKSETVENAVISQYDLKREYDEERLSDVRKILEKHVIVDGSAKDGMIRVSFRDRSPSRAADLANGYVNQYKQLSASLAIGEASQRRMFLERQLQDTKNNLATAEEQLKMTEVGSGVIQLDTQTRALIESTSSLRAQIAAKEVQVQSMRTYAGPENVDLIEAERELSGLRAQLDKIGGSESSAGGLTMTNGSIPKAGIEYVRKVREVKYNETIFEILARQYEAARLDEAREGSLIQVVDVARIPDKKSWPPRMLIILGSGFLGFAVAAFWLLIREGYRYLSSIPEYAMKLRMLTTDEH